MNRIDLGDARVGRGIPSSVLPTARLLTHGSHPGAPAHATIQSAVAGAVASAPDEPLGLSSRGRYWLPESGSQDGRRDPGCKDGSVPELPVVVRPPAIHLPTCD